MLEVESQGPILRLTLARPDTRNAINEELIELLYDQFVGLDAQVRVVVLTGEGSAFCAGGDLEWMRKGANATEEENFQSALRLSRLLESMRRCPAAVISKVNGHCFGGGCGFVAASDIAISVEKALFAFSEVRLGLVPAVISPVVMSKIGRGHARALFVTGETFDSEKALSIGLVQDVTIKERLDERIDKCIDWILSAGPHAVAAVKKMTQDDELSPDETARLLATTRAGDEAREGIAAFLEKRTPSYSVLRATGKP